MGPEEYLSPEKCRASACECYEMARKIGDPDARRELLSLVLKWYKLAEMIAADRGKLSERTLQHIGVYAYSRDALNQWVSLPPHPLEEIERLEQLRPLAAGLSIGVAVTNEPPASGIDTEEDLERANARWDAFMAGAVTHAGQ